jgi:hypothetical protein
MNGRRFAWWVAALAAVVTTHEAAAQELGPAAERAFAEFVTSAPHRTFYLAANGAGYSWSGVVGETPAMAVNNGLRSCREQLKTECRLYAVNNFLLGGRDWWKIVEARSPKAVDIGRMRPQPYWANSGPAGAAGLLVWSHDYEEAGERPTSAPGPYVGYFTKAGYDLYRFDRRWTRDLSADATQFVDMLRQARTMGYRRIVLAGLGGGAWVSLAAASHGAPVDGVIAIAPEYRGEAKAMADATARGDLQKAVAALPTGPRVFVVNLQRNAAVGMTPGANAAAVVDPPDFPDRASMQKPAFGRAYGDCIWRFIEAGERQAPCQ